MNKFFGQIKGPFLANQDLIAEIATETGGTVNYLRALGIQGQYGDIININEAACEIGPTGILDYGNDLNVTSLSFAQDVDENTVIDFIYE